MLVYRASIPFGMPMFLNMTTDMLLTMKYGMPSAKYSVGTHRHGVFFFIYVSIFGARGSFSATPVHGNLQYKTYVTHLRARGSGQNTPVHSILLCIWLANDMHNVTTRIIMLKYLVIGIATGCHYSGTDLAQTYAMSPTSSTKADMRP